MNSDFLLEMETFFLALADKTRLRLLNLMREGEVCVCFFTEVLGESQPKISRHLAYLRNAGIVEARREGKWMNYRIVRPESGHTARVLQDTLEWLESEEAMRKEYEKLMVACRCSPEEVPVTIARAPRPNISAKTDIMSETAVSSPKREIETFLL